MTKVLNTEIRRLVFELDLYFKNRQLCIGISFFILLTVNKPYIGIQLILKHKQMVLHYFIIKLQMVIDLEYQFITLILLSIAILVLLLVSFLIFFQSREQELIHTHALRFRISLDLLTLSLWHVDTDIIVMPFEVFRVRS